MTTLQSLVSKTHVCKVQNSLRPDREPGEGCLIQCFTHLILTENIHIRTLQDIEAKEKECEARFTRQRVSALFIKSANVEELVWGNAPHLPVGSGSA